MKRSALATFMTVVAAAMTLTLTSTAGASAATPNDAPKPTTPTNVTAPPVAQPNYSYPASVETVYVPITSCRIVDTRAPGLGKLGSGTSKNYYVEGAFSFFGYQGGSSVGCGIPYYASAVTGFVSAVSPSGNGFITSKAYTSSAASTVVNYVAGQSITVGATLPIYKFFSYGLTLTNYGGPTHVTIDVTGYFVPQVEATVASDGTLNYSSGPVYYSEKIGTGHYRVWVTGRDISKCAFNVTGYYAYSTWAQIGSASYVDVYSYWAPSAAYFDMPFSITGTC